MPSDGWRPSLCARAAPLSYELPSVPAAAIVKVPIRYLSSTLIEVALQQRRLPLLKEGMAVMTYHLNRFRTVDVGHTHAPLAEPC